MKNLFIETFNGDNIKYLLMKVGKCMRIVVIIIFKYELVQ